MYLKMLIYVTWNEQQKDQHHPLTSGSGEGGGVAM